MTSVVTRLTASMALAAAGLAMVPAGAHAVTEVRVVVPRNSAQTGPIFEAAAAAFEAGHPGIDILIEVVGWESLYQMLTGEITAGTPPDLAVIGTRWLPNFVANGAVEPLEARATPDVRNLFIPAFLTPSEVDGRLWGLPAAGSARALYYNRTLFAAAGIDRPPATWEALESDARAVAALDGETYGYGLQGKEIETDVYFYYAMWSHGVELIEEDGTSGLDSDAAIAAAEMYRRFIADGLTQPEVTAYNREDVQDLFKAGNVGMMITGPWLRDQLAQEAPGLDYAVAAVPSGTQSATYGVTDTMVMFAGSEAKDAAWQFMEYLSQTEFRGQLAEREGFLPTTIAESAAIADDPGLAPFAAMLPHARFTPPIANWEVIADITANALRRIYLGDEPPRDALRRAAAEIDAILGQ